MKSILMIVTVFALICTACQEEKVSDLEKAKQALESQRKELSDKQEMKRIESEMKSLNSELQKLNGVAPKKATQGRIFGTNVIMRTDASTQSDKMGNFKTNEVVQILNKQVFMTNDEGIVAQNLSIDPDFTLTKGKAVRITAYYSTSDTYDIQFERPGAGSQRLNVPSYVVEKTENESWYNVRRDDGMVGWVYGKFLGEI